MPLSQKVYQAINDLEDNVLDLSAMNIRERHVEELITALESNEKIKDVEEINLSVNHIKTKGAKHILNVICDYKYLKFVRLAHNNIRASKSKKFVDILDKSKSLRFFDLGGNAIENSGAEVIATKLKSNKTLKILYLDANDIEDDGMDLLKHALKENLHLERIDLFENQASESKIKEAESICLVNIVNKASYLKSMFGDIPSNLGEIKALLNDEMQEIPNFINTRFIKNVGMHYFKLLGKDGSVNRLPAEIQNEIFNGLSHENKKQLLGEIFVQVKDVAFAKLQRFENGLTEEARRSNALKEKSEDDSDMDIDSPKEKKVNLHHPKRRKRGAGPSI